MGTVRSETLISSEALVVERRTFITNARTWVELICSRRREDGPGAASTLRVTPRPGAEPIVRLVDPLRFLDAVCADLPPVDPDVLRDIASALERLLVPPPPLAA